MIWRHFVGLSSARDKYHTIYQTSVPETIVGVGGGLAKLVNPPATGAEAAFIATVDSHLINLVTLTNLPFKSTKVYFGSYYQRHTPVRLHYFVRTISRGDIPTFIC